MASQGDQGNLFKAAQKETISVAPPDVDRIPCQDIGLVLQTLANARKVSHRSTHIIDH